MTLKKSEDLLSFLGLDQEYIKESLSTGHIIEAIQLLHSELEALIRLLFTISFKVKKTVEDKKQTIESANELKYHSLSNALFIANIISRKQFDNLILCNKLRNRITHRLFEQKYDGEDNKIRKSECIRVAKIGLELMDELTCKIESI